MTSQSQPAPTFTHRQFLHLATFTTTVLFDGFYSVPEIKPLDNWRKQATKAAQRPTSRYAIIVQGMGGADALPAIQLAGNGRGKFVWAPGHQFGLNISNPYGGSNGVGLFDSAGQLPTFTVI